MSLADDIKTPDFIRKEIVRDLSYYFSRPTLLLAEFLGLNIDHIPDDDIVTEVRKIARGE